MTSTPSTRTLVTALLTCLLVLFAGPTVHASVQDTGGKGRSTFGVQPSGPKKPDRRSDFSYSVTPGAAVRDHIAVLNHSARPLTLKVYASDAFNTADGGFDLLAEGVRSKDAGSWIRTARSRVVIPARSRAVVPFTLTVPAGVAPGDHAAGVVASLASSRSDGKGDRVAVEQRVGARVHIRVAGELKPGLAVQDVRATYHGTANPFGTGSATVTYTVRNTGNIRLGARGTVRFANSVSGPLRAPGVETVKGLLPGNSVRVTATVRGLFPAVRSTATVNLDAIPVGGDIDPALPSATGSAGFWTVPWALLALLVLAAGLTVALVRRRRRRRPGGPTRPAPTDPHPSVPSVPKEAKTSMLIKRFTRPTALGLASLLAAAGGVLMLGTPAQAETLGTLGLTPPTGTDTSSVTLSTSGPCPEEADYLIVKVAGKGFPAEGQNVVGNSEVAIYPSAGEGLDIPLSETMRDYANTAGFKTLEGRYDFTVTCRKAFGESTFGDYEGSMWFTSNTAYQDTDPDGPEPTEPTGPGESPDPSESTDPTEPADPSESPDPTGSTDPTDTASPGDTADPTDTADPGTTDGGSTDGGSTDGGSTDGGSSDGGASGGGTDVTTEVSGGGDGGSLASTGSSTGAITLIALALVAAGTAAVWWARRRGLLTFVGGWNHR
ncbi:hypothetical protein [Streptomyces niveus]|uniref:hypothetical protein n=1 Tax=Streptomyces niveus TaxID=193462 RepID=UPI0033AB325F